MTEAEESPVDELRSRVIRAIEAACEFIDAGQAGLARNNLTNLRNELMDAQAPGTNWSGDVPEEALPYGGTTEQLAEAVNEGRIEHGYGTQLPTPRCKPITGKLGG